MIYKIATCFFVITLSSHGNEAHKKVAVSSQSFDRPDIPVSYKFNNVHNYEYKQKDSPKREHHMHRLHNQNSVRYPVIQYAPLVQATKPSDSENEQVIREESTSVEPPPLTGRHIHHPSTKLYNKHRNENLEPKPLREDDNVRQQNYISFISGHNVELYPPTTGTYLKADPFVTRQNIIYHKPKAKKPKFMYYQKPTMVSTPETTPKYLTIEYLKPTESHKLQQLMESDFKSPIRNEHKKSPHHETSYSLHNQLINEKQKQTYQHPRIHLNIARIYNIAHQPQEANLPQILLPKAPLPPTNLVKLNLRNALPHTLGKPPVISAALYLPGIINPQNTLMFPVRNAHKRSAVM